MSLEGSLNVGCGVYSWVIETPPPEPELPTDIHCNATTGPHYVSKLSIYENVKTFCKKLNSAGKLNGGSIVENTYNDGTPDLVRIVAQFDGGEDTSYVQREESECNDLFKEFLDSCNQRGTVYESYKFAENRVEYKTGMAL